ncbi:MAG: hypothetical protein IJI83_03635 [Oscillospiraceae bacterium]|nr:hypothetical protein [Oscillospiraceae bacterium]
MTAFRLDKKETLFKVVKSCTEIVATATNPRYKKVRYVAEKDEIYATNGIQLIIFQCENKLSDKNCTLSLAGEFLILEEEDFEDILYRRPLENMTIDNRVYIDWQDWYFPNNASTAPYLALEILARQHISVSYKTLGVFKHLNSAIKSVCFDKNPKDCGKPVLFDGSGISYMIMPLIRFKRD